MKKVKDTFSYGVGHGFIGLSCGHYCKYFNYNKNTKERECLFYKVFLNSIFLTEDGYVYAEFFCNKYENISDSELYKDAHELGLKEFNQIKNELEEGILYYGEAKEYLQSIPFGELKTIDYFTGSIQPSTI